MPKGRKYEYSGGHRQGQKSGSGYPGRGAASMPNSSTAKRERAMGYTGGKSGTLAGGNTQVMMSNEMRSDGTAGIMQSNPYPGKRGGGYSGPGRS